ncbi:MAG: tetratricopeptide repeat protein [Pseudomonadota bacterium]
MIKGILGIILLLAATVAQGDIWTNLFKQKLREANQGDSEAQYDVGTMYLNGRGVQASRATAVDWFTKAADQNNPQAITRLKLMHENEARYQKTLADAERGERDSQYELGNMYTKGIGIDVDYPKAIAAYEQAAAQGHEKAAYKLGLLYYEGSGVAANKQTAIEWFRKSATSNYPAAQYYLGRMYAAGEGTARDPEQALVWLGKAVDGGFDQARGAMIDVSESMAQAAAPPEQPPAAATPEPKPKPKPAPAAPARKPTRSSPAAEHAEATWSLEDLMLAAWYRDSEPVTFLPSAINNCKVEEDRLVCLSDDQTRRSGENLIKFKTKAIISHFTDAGAFDITYRNLVIDASQVASADTDAANNDDDDSAVTVKTGWGTPHSLECEFKNQGTLTCVKNGSYRMILTAPQRLISGK